MVKHYLYQALELAKIRRGFCAPNPSVGAVIVRDNVVLATGYHFAAGSPHAEIEALEKINYQAQDATIYITLEPCTHWGKTPPCIEALIKAGIKKVFYGYRDPNPLTMGQSESLLSLAGIDCKEVPLPEIDAFYESYLFSQKNKMPFVTAKIAITLDGKIAEKSGQRMQVTGESLRNLTHFYRKQSDAILTTATTIINDNPKFNARYQNEILAKPLYILDTALRLPENAAIFHTAQSITVFHSENALSEARERLIDLGVRCIAVKETEQKLDLHQVLSFIGQDGMQDLWIEAGGQCFSAFVKQGLLQRALIYIAPWALGKGLAAFNTGFDFRSHTIGWQQYGPDVLCDIRW